MKVKSGSRVHLDGDVVQRELKKIAKQNGGTLDPAQVVEASRPKNAPLHDHFEWDNRIAGDLYRLVQAGQLIRAVVIDTGPKEGERVWQHVTLEAASGYMETIEVKKSELLVKQVINSIQSAIMAQRRRLLPFQEFLREGVILDEVVAEIERKK